MCKLLAAWEDRPSVSTIVKAEKEKKVFTDTINPSEDRHSDDLWPTTEAQAPAYCYM